jgi:hypothetical protein
MYEFGSLKEWSLSWHCMFDLEVADDSGSRKAWAATAVGVERKYH